MLYGFLAVWYVRCFCGFPAVWYVICFVVFWTSDMLDVSVVFRISDMLWSNKVSPLFLHLMTNSYLRLEYRIQLYSKINFLERERWFFSRQHFPTLTNYQPWKIPLQSHHHIEHRNIQGVPSVIHITNRTNPIDFKHKTLFPPFVSIFLVNRILSK